VIDGLNAVASYSIQLNGVYHGNWWPDKYFNNTYLKDDIVREINIFWGNGYEDMLDYGRRIK